MSSMSDSLQQLVPLPTLGNISVELHRVMAARVNIPSSGTNLFNFTLSADEIRDHYTRMQILSLVKRSSFSAQTYKKCLTDLTFSRRTYPELKHLKLPTFLAFSLVTAATKDVVTVVLNLKPNGVVHFEFTSNSPIDSLLVHAQALQSVCKRALMKRIQTTWISFWNDFITSFLRLGIPKFQSILNAINGVTKSDDDWMVKKVWQEAFNRKSAQGSEGLSRSSQIRDTSRILVASSALLRVSISCAIGERRSKRYSTSTSLQRTPIGFFGCCELLSAVYPQVDKQFPRDAQINQYRSSSRLQFVIVLCDAR